MKTATKEAINTLITQANGFRTQAEEYFAKTSNRDAEWHGYVASANKALDDADDLKIEGELEDRASGISAWAKAPGAAPAPVIDYSRAMSTRRDDPTATAEYAAAFEAYCFHHANPEGFTAEHASILRAVNPEMNALTIVSDGGGGYTVPADRRADMQRQLGAISEILSLVFSYPTGRSLVEWPAMAPNQSSGLGDIYTSAGVGSFVGEVPSTTAGQNEQAFRMIQMPIKKARYMSLPSIDLVNDSEFNLDTLLLGDAIENMALLREYGVIAGTGLGNEPAGILKLNGGVSNADDKLVTAVDIVGTGSHTVSDSSSDLGSALKILDLIYAVPAQYRRLPSFRVVACSAVMKQVRKLTDFQGRFIWQAGFAGIPDTLEGYRTTISEFMPVDGVAGNIVMAAGPLNYVHLPVRQNATPQILLEKYADTDRIGLFVRQRFGVGLVNPRAFKFGIVS